MKRGNALLGLLLLLCFTSGCGAAANEPAPPQETEHSFFAMDTYITMSAYGGEDTENLLEEAEQLVLQLEAKLSVTDENSEINAVNHSGGSPVAVSRETEELIAFALGMARETGGALDPTIYPVLTAWGFTTGSYQVPSPEELDGLLEAVDYSKVYLEGISVTVPNGAQLDLGAVAKGYTGDKAAELLRERGVTSALINLGGNVQAIGGKPDGSPWRIGVKDPGQEGNLGVLEVKDRAVVTSGGYERYFTGEDGSVYWHILDPATGYPAHSGLASVTVVAPEGRRCDALSTALFVMGLEDAEEYWRGSGNFEMLLVTDTQEVYLTEGLEDSFTLSQSAANQNVNVIAK